jgi:hypothetical protein
MLPSIVDKKTPTATVVIIHHFCSCMRSTNSTSEKAATMLSDAGDRELALAYSNSPKGKEENTDSGNALASGRSAIEGVESRSGGGDTEKMTRNKG